MELFGEKGGNIDKLAADIRPCPRLGEAVDQNDGRDRHISTCEREYVQDIANATVSHQWHHPQRDLAVRAGLLAGGQRSRQFFSYREFSALRRTGDQSSRVLVGRYPGFLLGRALLPRNYSWEFSRRNGLSCLRNCSPALFAEPGRCHQHGEQTDSNRSADPHRSNLLRIESPSPTADSVDAPHRQRKARADRSSTSTSVRSTTKRTQFVPPLQRASANVVPGRRLPSRSRRFGERTS